MDHILSCGILARTDLEDYKEHVGAPTRCHILYGKCPPALEQLSTVEVCWAGHRGAWSAICWANGDRVSESWVGH